MLLLHPLSPHQHKPYHHKSHLSRSTSFEIQTISAISAIFLFLNSQSKSQRRKTSKKIFSYTHKIKYVLIFVRKESSLEGSSEEMETRYQETGRTIDREIKSIKRQEKECIKNIQKLAKKYPGDKSMFTPLAKQLVRTRKTVSRMMTTKAQLNSVSMTISQQYASIRIGEVMQKSTSVQKHMNAMLKLPQMRKIYRPWQERCRKRV